MVNDGALGNLEDDVGAKIALLDLVLDFAFEVVVLVLGLPEAVAEFPVVEQSAIHYDALALGDLNRILRGKRPIGSFTVSAQNRLKCVADGAFVVQMELAVLAECGVVVLDELVGRLDGEQVHGMWNSLSRCARN